MNYIKTIQKDIIKKSIEKNKVFELVINSTDLGITKKQFLEELNKTKFIGGL